MNHSQWIKLTPEQQRIKVAELCGWKNIKPIDYACCPDEWLCFFEIGDNKDGYHFPIPIYTEDLNAMHEAEEELTDIQFCKYVQILCGHVTHGVRILWCGEDAGRACRSTAAQRAEAFVLTMEEARHG